MKKLTILFILLGFSLSSRAVEVSRMEPAFWWVGMKNPELQVMVYGKNIARAEVQFDYPGVHLKEIIRADSPNYLFIYLTIDATASPGTVDFTFREGKKKTVKSLELKPRATTAGAQGFTSADVLYLIMPDRFANGDPSNDFWDDEAIDRNEPSARHGGDLAGIRAHLDYLDDLGVTAIWLNPVLENKMNSPEKYKSYHGYAITDFYTVDKRLGTNEEYRLLIENIHRRGMKIVMDMIYNHCGNQHWWMNDLPCKDWLNHQEGFVPTTHNLYAVMDPHAPPSEALAMTDGWFVPAMPDLNQRNPLLADYLIQNSIWWIEYARIDGIRHDTHPYADFDFLSRWCKAVFDEYPAFNIVGESWYANGAPLAWWQAGSKVNHRQSHLKTVMDFNLMIAVNRSFSIESPEANPFKALYETVALDFLYPEWNNLLIFLDNHDTSRFCKEGETGLNRYKQAIAFLLTTRGIPQIYYGTELLMSGEKKDGDGILRRDFPGGWAEDQRTAFTATGRTALENDAHDYLQKLLRWRKDSPAVNGGKLIHYAPGYSTECYVYARIKGDDKVLVILNGSTESQTLAPEKYAEVIGKAVSGKEIISGKTVSLKEEIIIPPQGVFIMELK
ncbi:MAG: glycoside hydrolase family 13 protein [Dysgonamonadaceae bacterium]|jgi:glycosidase|nr:glycoside hydrolase family 13 protein [Dysgonamonadaceae bacterium]